MERLHHNSGSSSPTSANGFANEDRAGSEDLEAAIFSGSGGEGPSSPRLIKHKLSIENDQAKRDSIFRNHSSHSLSKLETLSSSSQSVPSDPKYASTALKLIDNNY